MINNHENWRRLKAPIMVLGLALVAVGLVAYYAEQYNSQQTMALEAQKSQLNQARQKYLLSGQERELIVQYLPIYQHLISSGFVGEEQRIEWIEKLRQLHQQHKLFSIEYNIALQENFAPNFLPSLGNFKLNKSTMKLNMGLLHEEDLLTLLDGLQAQTTPFMVRECEMSKPVGVKINPTVLTNHLQATCEIDWLTLKDPQLRAPT